MPRTKYDPKDVKETVSIKLLPHEAARLMELKDIHERTASFLGRKLLLRGLEMYELDGLLDSPALAVAEEQNKQTKRKAS